MRKPSNILQLWQWKSIFYGNFFYAFCAIALSVESTFQTQSALPSAQFFVMEFLVVVWFYNKAYLKTEEELNANNERQAWYAAHRNALVKLQSILLLLLVGLGAAFLFIHYRAFLNLRARDYLLALSIPAVSFLYYGFKAFGKTIKLRRVGWLKPIIIAVSWAGFANIYPALYLAISNNTAFTFDTTLWFLFMKNVLFVGLIAVLFDIKDYNTDLNYQLKTVVVKLGIYKTVYYLVVPICLFAWLFLLAYGHAHQFSTGRIVINTLPLLAVIPVSLSLFSKKNILYYLMVIDGLLLLKAFCGISAALLF